MRKGQEEAPIELLLAVTLLTFVIIIGFYTYQNLCGTQYEQKLKASLSSFARSMELVYQGGVGTSKVTSVDFGEIGCASGIESIRLIQGTPTTCQRNIGKTDCLELIVVRSDSSGPTPLMLEMMNIPSDVTVKFINAPSECDNQELNSIEHDTWSESAYANCGWKAKSYSFRMTKVTGGIELELIG